MRCLLLALIAGSSLAAQDPRLEALHQAELAFARMAETAGIQPAFAAWLQPEAKVFLPRMTPAREHYAPGSVHPGLLSWRPEAMGLAASGELAWSTGPWTFAPRPGAPVVVRGHFLSIWRLLPGQGWRVVADIGVPHGDPGPMPTFTGVAPDSGALAPRSGAAAATALQEQEAALTQAWQAQGGAALIPWLAREAWVLRPGRLPLRDQAGREAALAAEGKGPAGVPSLLEVSAAGDLGWTCGEAPKAGAAPAFSFLRVWVREGGAWRVRFEVRLPHPAAQP